MHDAQTKTAEVGGNQPQPEQSPGKDSTGVTLAQPVRPVKPNVLHAVVWHDAHQDRDHMRVFTTRDEAKLHLNWVLNGWDDKAELVNYSPTRSVLQRGRVGA